MNANAKKWVEALRSGKYQQGKNSLRPTETTYCCLGVACEVAKGEGFINDYEESLSSLPRDVAKWLGLADREGSNVVTEPLTYLNDTMGKSFSQIADIIESEPDGLFAGD